VSREAITADALTRAAHQRLWRFLPWPSRALALRPLIRSTQAAISLRERARYKQALLYSRLRRIALELGERLSKRHVLSAADDVFFLTLGEIDELISGVAMFPQLCRELIVLRRKAHAQFATEIVPDTFSTPSGSYTRSTSIQGQVRAHGDASALRGSSVCAGVARGPAKILTDVAETHTLRPGDVLVTRQTDPGWAPAFAVIGALVLERGGMLSHGAILAREYGIPTVVGIEGATERIGSGCMVEVDGDSGDVRLLV
jgi:pyruvate,water dikinase